MISGAIATFTDLDAFQEAVRGARVTRYSLIETGTFRTTLQRLNIGRVWTQRGEEGLARSAHLDVLPSRNAMIFLTDADGPPISESGLELTGDRIVFYGQGVSSFQHSDGPVSWSSISLAPEDLDEAGRLLLDRSIGAPSDSIRLRPRQEAIAQLRHLHRRANAFARDHAFALHPEIARSMESDLVAAMMHCLDGGIDEYPRGYIRRLAIVRRFRDWLEMNTDRAVYLNEVCQALGVTARVLRSCCHEHLGVGPIRYLWLRRMALARRALLFPRAGLSTVTAVAMNFGFWELGRFSVSYRSLYGESPSDTIARSSARRRDRDQA